MNATWQQTRMNLNTFARHGVFERTGWFGRSSGRKMAKVVGGAVARQGGGASLEGAAVPAARCARRGGLVRAEIVKDALEDAMETSLENVPAVNGAVYVCCDVSGSMSSPVTGHRPGATSVVRCIDVAAIVAAAMLRKNDCRVVLPFEHRVVELHLDKRDRVLVNAKKLASIGGGGTSCSVPLAQLNEERARGELVLYVSDNESWVRSARPRPRRCSTSGLCSPSATRRRSSSASICSRAAPCRVKASGNVLDVGGFSDAVFDVVARFCKGGSTSVTGSRRSTPRARSTEGRFHGAECLWGLH